MPARRVGEAERLQEFWMPRVRQNDRDVLHLYRIACRVKGSRLVRNGVQMSIDDARLSPRQGQFSEFSNFCRQQLREDLQLIIRYNAIHGRTTVNGDMQIHPQDNINTHQLTRDRRTNDYEVALKCQWRKALMKAVLANELLRNSLHKYLNGKLLFEARVRNDAAALSFAAEQRRQHVAQMQDAALIRRRRAYLAEQRARYGI